MYAIHIQRAAPGDFAPSNQILKYVARTALQHLLPAAEITIRLVDTNEMTALNSQYRKKNGPTNVLSFPHDAPAPLAEELPFIGDIVICAKVVNDEATAQSKMRDAHWAHMIVHGTLHLLGHDHQENQAAEEMERLEINILKELGYPNPYQ